MGKIYDALKRAEEEAKNNRRQRQSIDSGTIAKSPLAPETYNSQRAAAQKPKMGAAKDEARIISPLKLMPQGKAPLQKKDRLISLLNILAGRGNGVAPASMEALVTLKEPHSFVAEQYRILKTRILNVCKEKNMKTILITSALAGEGKSTVSANLAISIAQTMSEHALLLDCDLRRPTVHKLFNLTNRAGLSNYLNGGISLDQALEKTEIEKLTALPAGTILDNPSELLSSSKMADLLHELKNHYHDRYILLDSTPVQQTVEPGILAQQVDCIIFVIKAGHTGREVIKRAIDSLAKQKIVGIVFNMTRKSVQSSYYYNYYSSYSEESR